MPFTENDKLKALSIVSIFETSKPLGDYAACVVLNDGAGVSYGLCQFTHRSGSLADVVERYLTGGGRVAATTLDLAMPWLKKRTAYAIRRLAGSEQFRKALISAAVTREMKEAQNAVAFERYLRPALEYCDGRGFEMPLSLAVVYDSIVHGSFDRIARLVHATGEREWITEYVRRRHLWLSNIARLKSTTYRTKFFLNQISIGNWDLRLPVDVHGVKLGPRLAQTTSPTAVHATAEPIAEPAKIATISTQPTAERSPTPPQPQAAPAAAALETAVTTFDRIDSTISSVTTRTDRAKSLWTTVAGTAWQTAWAIFGWIAGIPHEVWMIAAVIVALLLLLYLYRQISLGKLRETASSQADG